MNDWIELVPKNNIIRHYKSIFNFASSKFNVFEAIMSCIDVFLVIFLLVLIVKKLKDTRVLQLFKGIVLLLIVNVLSDILKLPILHLIFSSITTYGILILVIIFQPELRKMLEQIGTRKINKYLGFSSEQNSIKMKENIYKIAIACMELAKTKTGALIVIERDIKITEIIQNGIPINADVSVQLLENIFVPNTPLHDGAVVISDGVIKSACSILPLTDDEINKAFGTRHRAALGISKNSDAIAVVVSEETGKVSVAKDGTLIVDLKEDVLKKVLLKNLIIDEDEENQNTILKQMNKVKKKFKKTKANTIKQLENESKNN